MSKTEKLTEEQIFKQEIADDELETVAGGKPGTGDPENCNNAHRRNIYGGDGFPNCAATVEDGSHCGTNDACWSLSVSYKGMKECNKAHR
jgi:hypothetical protein